MIKTGKSVSRMNWDQHAGNTTGFTNFMRSRSPYVLIICIFLAEFFATAGLITKSRTLFAIKETLRTIGFLAVLPLAIKDEELERRTGILGGRCQSNAIRYTCA